VGRSTSGGRIGLIARLAALTLLLGAPHAAFAQDDVGRPQQDADRDRARGRLPLQAQDDGGQNQPGQAPGGQAGDAAGDAEQIEGLIEREGEVVTFSAFAEPVDLQALVDFVSRELGVNIMITDTGLQGAQVVFRAPMDVPRGELLSLLAIFLEQNGYALTREPDEGWLVIRPSGELPIDRGEGALATTRVFPTPLVRPTALQNDIDTLLPGGEQASRKVSYNDELGVIITTATPRTNRAIEEIVNLILQQKRGQRLERFDLSHIAASEARDRIVELTTQGGGARAGAPRGGAAAGGGGGGGAQGGGATGLSNVASRLIIDRRGNSLIFRGDPSEIDEVGQLISLVDQPSRMVIRRYTAGPLASAIASYGSKQGLGPVEQLGQGGGPQGGGGASAGGGAGFIIEDLEAGILSYYGTEEQHEQVAELVEKFVEQGAEQAIVVEFYRLQHADAEEVADLLQELLDLELDTANEEGGLLPGSLTGARTPRRPDTIQRVEDITGTTGQAAPVGGGAEPGAEGEATLTPTEDVGIIPDAALNQIIIRAPRRQQQEFARIIERLDTRRPQVYIDIQIVSVTKSETFFLTIETALDAIGPDSVPAFTNFGFRGDPFSTDIPTTAAGFTAGIIRSSYVPFIINTLATEGNGRLLSNPTLLVNDNQEASLSSTRDEPFAETSQVAGAPSTTAFAGNISAGTIVNITPQISDGGFLILEFAVELSDFAASDNPDLPPPQNSNNFESVVTVPSDSTVVVGGFRNTDTNRSVQKVPLLGDIPLLGELFKERSASTNTSTVYVFITPRVLSDPTFADLRLLSKGPMSDAEVEDVTPGLEPVVIPLVGYFEQQTGRGGGGEGLGSNGSDEGPETEVSAADPADRANNEGVSASLGGLADPAG